MLWSVPWACSEVLWFHKNSLFVYQGYLAKLTQNLQLALPELCSNPDYTPLSPHGAVQDAKDRAQQILETIKQIQVAQTLYDTFRFSHITPGAHEILYLTRNFQDQASTNPHPRCQSVVDNLLSTVTSFSTLTVKSEV